MSSAAPSGATTWVEVDARALGANLETVAHHAGVPVCAVVKANGYGHGLVEAATVLERAGAPMLAVTRIEEARALRDAGVRAEVLVMMPVQDPGEAASVGCAITVGSRDEVAALPAAARVHLKVDSGMGRLGVRPEEALDAARAVAARARLEAVWTHLAAAATSGGLAQLARFRAVLDAVANAGLHVRAHAANSEALLARPDARFDMVRVGTLLYGQSPPGALAPWPLQETFRWLARVAAVRTLPPGATLGYGSEWRARVATRVATIPIGYADGFSAEPVARTPAPAERARGVLRAALRRDDRAVYFGERRAPVLGRVAMQAITVAVDGMEDVVAGSIARIPARRLMVSASIPRVVRGAEP